jgi:hypothetical protein
MPKRKGGPIGGIGRSWTQLSNVDTAISKPFDCQIQPTFAEASLAAHFRLTGPWPRIAAQAARIGCDA